MRDRRRSSSRRDGQILYQRRACQHQTNLIAVETDEHLERSTFVVFEPVRAFDNASLKACVARRLAPDAEVYSDGLACFRPIEEAGHAHTVLETGGGRAAAQVQGARWVNSVLANVKRAISGVYHALDQHKYARRYLAEAAYRFNRRFRLRALMPRLTRTIMLCKPCPERSLRLASNFVH